jgi:lysyl-tRNA synthetase, class II
MADQQPADQAADAVAKLHLDDVTGEMISKSELKKRQKAREKEAAKKEKAASKPAAPTSSKSAEAKEKELTPNQYFEIRSRTVNELHAQGKAYPHKVCTPRCSLYRGFC